MKKRLVLVTFIILVAAGAYLFFARDKDQAQPNVTKTADTPKTQVQEPVTDLPLFDKAMFSVDDPKSIWIVSNKKRPLNPKDYVPSDLVFVGGQQLRKEAADALTALIAAAKAEGLGIQPLSGYRSYNTQVTVYNREVSSYGQSVADTQSARPGHSEHQTGLAIDVGGGGCGIEDCFGNTAAGKWLAANAHTFGFILRYPEGKQAVTGYRYEPWHIRYVGKDLSAKMKKEGVLTLEEFFGLPPAPTY